MATNRRALAAPDAGHAPQQRLDEGGLAVAGLAEDPAVGVGGEALVVGLERVPAELAAAGEQVDADVDAPVPEPGCDAERVDGADVRGGAPVARQPQRAPTADASRHPGAGEAETERQGGGPGEVLAAVEGPQLQAVLAGELLALVARGSQLVDRRRR